MKLRNENPRPNFIRNSTLINLNGERNFDFDDNDIGHQNEWFLDHQYTRKIIVPFPFQSELSGIKDVTAHDRMWYHLDFEMEVKKDKRYIIVFNGVDYYCELYINKKLIDSHKGASTIFKVDITEVIVDGKNEITLFCKDETDKQDFPRGKQYREKESDGIFYTRTSGIYKSVYLEEVSELHLEDVYIKTDIDNGTVHVEGVYSIAPTKIQYTILKDGKEISQTAFSNENRQKVCRSQLKVWNSEDIYSGCFHDSSLCWSPENPVLYDLIIKVYDEQNELQDEVKCYFGMRKVHYEKGIFYLNNRPYYQKLVLMQGYYRKGILSHESIDDLKKDIELAKAMGFNGGRIHQKIEDPYFYYLCDKLGFIAWLECPSAQIFTKNLVKAQVMEWQEIVKQNYNHPSILVEVPLNESWGVPNLENSSKQRDYQSTLYYLTKAIDNSRLVVGNDGWEMVATDIYSIHNYAHGKPDDKITHKSFKLSLKDRKSMLNASPAGRRILLTEENKDIPIMLTEFGGLSLIKSQKEGKSWGYTNTKGEAEYIKELTRIFKDIASSTAIVGYCYTQLYDVEQEENGLLDYDRNPKIPCEKIKEINDLVPNSIILVK